MNTVPPGTVGVSAPCLEQLSTEMQSWVNEARLPGAVSLVARRGQLIHAGCKGWRDLEARQPMQLDTLFPIFSMTKPITSAAVMLLYEEGHFQLDDPISRFIPGFCNGRVLDQDGGLAGLTREITLRDLLSHTAGLATGFGRDKPLARLYDEAGLYQPGISLRDFTQKLAHLPLLHQPGAAWRYGESYEVLAFLVELLSGMPFADFLRTRIFDPLEMDDTSFGFPEGSAGRAAKFYGVSESGAFVENSERAWLAPSQAPRGSFGLVSTASDYLRFAQMLLNHGEWNRCRLLDRKSVQWMTQNHLPEGLLPIRLSPEFPMNGYGYGLGFRVLTDPLLTDEPGSEGEFGWYGYEGTNFWIDPKKEIIGLIMMRLDFPSYTLIAGPRSYFEIFNKFKALTYQSLR